MTLNAFQGKEHQPFTYQAGQPAALLVHGFPGTPAELRPLADSLHENGWTVQGLLLPGFGPEINSLFDKTCHQWITAITQTLEQLQQNHHPVLLIGYSMGAALSISAAVDKPPTGLVAIAPFQRLGKRWQAWIAWLLKPFFPHVYPFRKIDFTDPKTRQELSNFLAGVDLDDPTVQQNLRQLQVPIRIFKELNLTGALARQKAPHLTTTTCLIQGTRDKIVSLNDTRQLLQRFPSPVQYHEIEAGHDLINPSQVGWSTLKTTVLHFAEGLKTDPNSSA